VRSELAVHAADVGLLEIDDRFRAQRWQNESVQDALVLGASTPFAFRGDVVAHEIRSDFAERRDSPRLSPFFQRVGAAFDRAQELTRQLAGLGRCQRG